MTPIDHLQDRMPSMSEPLLEVSANITMGTEQLRLWFLDQHENIGAAYVLNCAWWLTGRVDERALAAAVLALADRHELLRASCRPVGDGAVLVIHATPETVLRIEQPGSVEAVEARLAELVELAMPLEHGPLFTAYLLRADEQTTLLVWRVHHLVADGWSLDVMAEELAALYQPGEPCGSVSLGPLRLTAAEVGAALLAAAEMDDEEEASEFWRTTMSGAPEVIDLPQDRLLPVTRGYFGDRTKLVLPPRLVAGVREFTSARGATTLFMVLHGALSGFLGRLSNTQDVVIGVPVANRPTPDFEGLVGFFVNTIPLRVDLTDDPHLTAVVDRVRTAFLDAYMHRNLPFNKIVRAVGPERLPGRTPLFQVLCVLQNTGGAQLRLSGLDVRKCQADASTIPFDLIFDFEEVGDEVSLTVEFSTELFSPESGRRLATRFVAFLADWVSTPAARLSDLSLLDETEEERFLAEPAASATGINGDVLTDIKAALAADPAREVLRSGALRLTGAELLARTARLTAGLAAAGGGEGTRVGVRLTRGVNTVVALLAILELGAVYVPLDARAPIERLRLVTGQAELGLLLCEDQALADELGFPSVSPDAAGTAADLNGEPGKPDSRDDRDGYLLFTSGSTGLQKGVLVGRKSLTNLIRESVRRFGLSPQDIVIASTDTSFDISLLELLAPLVSGSMVEVADIATSEDPTALAELIGRAGATFVQATPSVWRLVLEHLTARLRVVLVGGEALDSDLKDGLLAVADEVHNCYGPTETTIWSSVWQCAPGPVSVGTALANNELYVVDRWSRPAAPGSRGELLIGGAALARGYVGQPELTAQQFVTLDFGHGARRLYRTGDIASWGMDGSLRVYGRRDSQIKVRGHRIELGEIGLRIREILGVAQCALVPFDRQGQVGVAAFLVAEDKGNLDVPDLKRQLARTLPSYMVPAFFVVVPAIPRLPSGKNDTRALLAVLDAQLAMQVRAAALVPSAVPDTPVAEVVTLAFQAVLRRPVHPDCSFFDQGGDSLDAARVVALLRKALGIQLRLPDLISAPTVTALAARCEDTADAITAAESALADLAKGIVGPAAGLVAGRLKAVGSVEGTLR